MTWRFFAMIWTTSMAVQPAMAARMSSVGRGPVSLEALSTTTSWPEPVRATNRDPPSYLRLTFFSPTLSSWVFVPPKTTFVAGPSLTRPWAPNLASLLACELGSTQLGIEPVGGEQIAVRTPLNDAALGDDQDLIGLAHRRQPVGDHHRRAASQRRPERQLHRQFRLRVEVRRRLVEHHDVGRLEQQPGNRNALLLAPRQPVAAVAHHCVEAGRQRFDQRQDLGGPQCLNELLG